MLSLRSGKSSCGGLVHAVVVAAALTAGSGALAADSPPAGSPSEATVITNAQQIWAMPSAEKRIEHPLKLEGRVNYYDWRWKMLWLRQDGVCTYIQLAAPVRVPALKSGERVRLAGTIVPERGIEFNRVTVVVLRDYEPVEPLSTRDRINDLAALHSHIVTVDAYVDDQSLVDPDHLRLNMIVESRSVIGWVDPDNPEALPDWRGCFVRLVGMYSRRLDPTGTQSSIEIYVVRQADVTVTGTIEANRLFDRSVTPINQLYQQPVGAEVRIRGQVESHDVGSAMIVRDGTGEVQLRSIQTQRLAVGAPVEAVGRVAVTGGRWVLEGALYRHDPKAAVATPTPPAHPAVLTTIAEIRQLTDEEMAQHRPVDLSGMVTWSLPGECYFFLQDARAGIRVAFDPASIPTPALLKYLRVEGVTTLSGSSPAIELHAFDDLGAMSPPTPRPVTYNQAISGRNDGNWVQVRGFVEKVVSDGNRRWIHVITPSGEFIGRLESPVNFVANRGSLLRMCGVCKTAVGRDGRVNGVMLLVPFLHDLSIEEDAPVNLFDLPLRTVRSVNQLSGGGEMMRVRVGGVVTYAVPGQFAYIEDQGAGLLLIGRDTTPLLPGDRVEAVGIWGREGARTILRDATIRRMGRGPPPEPDVLGDPAQLSLPLDSRLVRVRGTVLDVFHGSGQTRITMQSDRTIFDALLDDGGAEPPVALGEGLELTGIYRIVFDDSRQERGFRLYLRTPADVIVVRPAKFWTVPHALIACGILAGCVLLGLGWITALRRRVHRQTEQLRAQHEHQTRLEAEVQRAARLESLGTLAGGIAHDFNNLLTIVLGNTSLALTEPDNAVVAGHLREIERGARRARELTQQLLTFAKGGAPLRSSVSLAEVVKDAADLVLHATNVRSEFDLAPDLWSAHVDREQMAQAIENLARNAVQAMPQGGVLRLKLHNERVAIGDQLGLAPGRYLKLVVADTGPGIDPAALPRIFDPYFTIRKEGGGLGLATVYSIVRKHQGHIEVESEPGRGTAFHLWLPASVDSTPPIPVPGLAPATMDTAMAAADRPPRVLVMDDEESIRRVLEIFLRRVGAEPIVVEDGAAALRVFADERASGRPIDLLILDLTVPGGMGGRRVIEKIRRVDAETPAIVASGYSNDPVLANFGEYGFQAMVKKPFDIRTLSEVIGRFISLEQAKDVPV